MPATAQRIAFSRGHQDAVLCLAATSDSQLLASGSEDGGVCLHHLPSSALLCRLQCCPADSEDTAIGAVAWHPKELPADAFAHLLTGSSSSGSSSSSRLLFAGAGRELLVLVLLLAPPADSCPDSLDSANHQAPPTTAAAAAADTDQPHAPGNQGILPSAAAAAAADGVDVPQAQLHVLLRGAVSQDDISSLSVNAAGTYLAAADDTGDVQLFDLQQLQKQLQELHALPQQQQQQQKQQQQQQSLLQPCRTIAGAHDPMATAVGFRGAHKPWQLLSGGVDSRVALWDFSRPKKCCSSWNMQHMNGVSPSIEQCAGLTGDSNSSSSNGVREVGSQQQQGQLWNPPMVHSLAVPWVLPEPLATAAAAGGGGTLSSSSSNGAVSVPAAAAAMVPSVPAAVAKHLVAVARGDGVVAVFDANPDAKPASKPDKQQSSTAGLDAGARTPTGQQRPGSSSSSSSRTGKGGGTGKGGRGAASPQQQQAHAASTASDANKQQAQQTVPLQQQQQQQQPSEVPPGFHLCLGASLGGHTLPAAAAVFLPWGGGARFLLSGGQDGRLLLWDWPAAFGAAAAAAAATAVADSDGDPVSAAGAGAGVPGGEHDSRGKETATPPAAAGAAAGERSRHGCLLLEKEHKRKVNALCCCWAPPVAGAAAAAVLLLVADTASRISVYRVKL